MNLPDLPSRRTMALIVLVLLVSGGLVVATSHTWETKGPVTWGSPDGPWVTTTDTNEGTTTTPISDANTVDFGAVGFSSSGRTDVTASDIGNETTSLSSIDTNGTTLSVTDSTKQDMDISGGITAVEYSEVNISSDATEYTVTGSGQLDVHGFSASEQYLVVYDDGSAEAVESDGSGVVSVDTDSGTSSFTFRPAPSFLDIRKEAAPNELVDNTSLTVTFFSRTGDEVDQRNTSDGTVNMTGLDLNTEYTVTVDEQNETGEYHYRRIAIDSIAEQSTIYLLEEDADTSQIVFELQDRTGRFDPSSTVLYVERALTRDFDDDGENETQYAVITGDNFGGSGAFPAYLETDERYRLRVVNDQGETRVLGSYTVSGDAREILTIGQIQLGADPEEGVLAQANLLEGEASTSIRTVYQDTGDDTSELTITVTNSSGTQVYQATDTGPYGEHVSTIQLPNHEEEESYTVVFSGTRDGEEFEITRRVGNIGALSWTDYIDGSLLGYIGILLTVGITGFVVINDPPGAAIVAVAVVGLFTALGVFHVAPLLIAFAGGFAVLMNIGRVR